MHIEIALAAANSPHKQSFQQKKPNTALNYLEEDPNFKWVCSVSLTLSLIAEICINNNKQDIKKFKHRLDISQTQSAKD